MAKPLEISFAIGAVLTGGFTGAFKQANQAMTQLQGQGKSLSNAMKDISAYQKMQGSLTQTSDKLNQARNRVRELAAQMRATDNPSASLKAQFAQANKEAHNLQQTLGTQRKELAALGQALNKAGIDTKNLTGEQARLTQESQRVTEAQNKLAKARANFQATREKLSFDNIKGDLIQAAGISASLAAPTMAAADYEMANARLNAVAFSGAGRDKEQDARDFAALQAQSRQLGRDTQFTAVQVTQTQENLARAGFKANEIISAMPGLLDMAASEGMDLAAGADIMASALRGFGLQAQDSGRVSNILAQTSTASKTSISGLGESLKYVAPVAAGLGISIEEVNAMLGKMGDAGIEGSQGGTALRAALTRLSKEPAAVAKEFDKLGISARDSQGNLQEIPDLMNALNVKIKGMGNADQLQVLARIFGDEASAGMLAVMNTSVDGSLQQLTRLNRESSGNLQALAQNTGHSMETLRSSMTESDKAARRIGVSFSELSVYSALLADQNITGAQADKTLTTAFTQLAEKPQQVSQALQAFNVSAYDSEGYVRNFTSILTDLNMTMQNMSDSQKALELDKIFGKGTGENLNNLMQGIGSQSYQQYSTVSQTAQGTSGEMAAKMLDTLKGQMEIAKSAISDLSITIGDVLLPSVKSIVQGFAEWTAALGEFAKEHPGITKFLTGAVASIGALAVMRTGGSILWNLLKLPVDGVKLITASFEAIKVGNSTLTTMSSTFSNMGGIIGMLTNPVTLWTAGIAAAGVAAYEVYQHWDEIKAFFANWIIPNIWEPLTSWATEAISSVKGLWEDFTNWLSSLNPFSSWKAPTPDPKTVEAGKKAIVEKHGTTDLRPSYMKAFATGGIISRPVIGLVGEAGKEAIIPLERQGLGTALWLQAGQELGMINQASAQEINYVDVPSIDNRLSSLNGINQTTTTTNSTSSIANQVSPVFNITFTESPKNEQDFMSMFRSAWERFQNEEMRLSFA